MQKKPARLWITSLIIGWLFDILFYKHAPGISFAIYIVICLLAGFILLRLENIRPARQTLILLPFILFFAAISFIRAEPLSALLSHALSLFLMAGLVVTYRGGLWLHYSLADYLTRALDLIPSVVARPLAFMLQQRQPPDQAAGRARQPSQLWPIIRGIAVAIPVITFFAMLLSSADMVFSQRLNALTSIFNLGNLPEYLFRIIYILVLAYMLAGVFLHAAQRSTDEKLLGLEKPFLPRFFGFTEASILLGSVALLFAAFVFIQFQYFFGGQANIHIEGFTYAEYARQGFGELIMVAFFTLLLLLGLSSVVRRETPLEKKIFSGLGLGLVALLGVMLVSAYQRLALYESAYGFTRLRTYSHVFIVWVAILLLSVALLDLLQRQRAFALAALLASLGFAISLTMLNVDAFIVQRNITRFEQGQDLDVGYLASLSSDAIPALVNKFLSSPLNTSAHDQIGAALACFQSHINADQRDRSWQSSHLSVYWADTSLGLVNDALKTYKTDNKNWPTKVSTPLGRTFDCYSYTD